MRKNILKNSRWKKNYIEEIRKSTIYPAKICMQQDKTRAEIKYTCKSAILPADLTEGKWHRILGMLLLIYPMKTCPSTVVLRDCEPKHKTLAMTSCVTAIERFTFNFLSK